MRMQPAREFEYANFNLFQAIVEQAPDAIIFADREGAIRVWNCAAEAVFGYAAAEILGNSLVRVRATELEQKAKAGFNEDA